MNTSFTKAITRWHSTDFLSGAGGARTRDDQIMSLLVPAGARPPPLTQLIRPPVAVGPQFREFGAADGDVVIAVTVELAHRGREDRGVKTRINGTREAHQCVPVPASCEVKNIDEVAWHRPIEQCQQLSCGEFPGSERAAEERHRRRQIRWRVEADVDHEVILADNGEANQGVRLLHRFNHPLPVGSGASECLDSHRHIAGLGREDVEILGRAIGDSVRRERETPASRKEPASGMAKKTVATST